MSDPSQTLTRYGPWLRLAGLGLALWVLIPGISRPLGGHLIDNVNLIFHEAGHMILMFAGETITLLGGSFFQLLIPAVCIGSFLLRRDRYAAGICTLWLGESLAGVGAYIADAPTRNLDLLTGDPDTHDWWQLLGAWNMLDSAVGLGRFVHALALVCVIAGLLLAVWDDLKLLSKEGGR